MDLRFVQALTEKPGPFATAYLDASHDTEDAARAGALRWAGARTGLAERGADEATLAALDAGAPAVGRVGRLLVAAGGEVLLDRELAEPPATPRVGWGPLPDLVPLLTDQVEPLAAVADAVERAVLDVADADRQAQLERFDQALGRSDGLAAQGVEPVLAALRFPLPPGA